MQVTTTNTRHDTSSVQTALQNEKIREEKKRLEEVTNEETLRIQAQIDTASTTGIGGSIDFTA